MIKKLYNILTFYYFLGVDSKKNKFGETALFAAAKKDDFNKCKTLIGEGANPNLCDAAGTFSHQAIKPKFISRFFGAVDYCKDLRFLYCTMAM